MKSIINVFFITITILNITSYVNAADFLPPSKKPPKDLPANNVPQFVMLGFDDNYQSGIGDTVKPSAMKWVVDYIRDKINPKGNTIAQTFDGTSARISFYVNTLYLANPNSADYPTRLKRIWNRAYVDGNDVGNHTHSHGHGSNFSASQWNTEIKTCNDWLVKPLPDSAQSDLTNNTSQGAAIPAEKIVGFRTPYLEYNDNTFTSLVGLKFLYDCSIEEGALQEDQNETSFMWPYTMDNGSPANSVIKSHPGFWEIPTHPVIAPPDNECQKYGIPTGFRKRLQAKVFSFDTTTGKITGLDYNLWVTNSLPGCFAMTPEEVLATLKFTLDKRYNSNRCPFMFGGHTQFYEDAFSFSCPGAPDTRKRQQAIEKFIEYALSLPDVRIVTPVKVIEWLRNPVTLDGVSIATASNPPKKGAVLSVRGRRVLYCFNQQNSVKEIEMKLYAINGACVASMIMNPAQSTQHTWNIALSIPSGVYVLRVQGNSTIAEKITLY